MNLSVWNALVSCGENTLYVYLDTRPRAKIHIFLSGSPITVRPSNCQKIQPFSVCFLLTASFAPRFGISEARRQPATPLLGLF